MSWIFVSMFRMEILVVEKVRLKENSNQNECLAGAQSRNPSQPENFSFQNCFTLIYFH